MAIVKEKKEMVFYEEYVNTTFLHCNCYLVDLVSFRVIIVFFAGMPSLY